MVKKSGRKKLSARAKADPRSQLTEICKNCGDANSPHPRCVHLGNRCLRAGCNCTGFEPQVKAKIL